MDHSGGGFGKESWMKAHGRENMEERSFGLDCNDWPGLDLDGTRLDWTEVSWTGPDWAELGLD